MNLKKVNESEYRECILGILKRIHNVCSQNDIYYTIGFGTLIGAVRHQGFIPWDDDIDICILREDFKRFKSLFSTNDGRYYILDSNENINYYNNMARACDNKMLLKVDGVLDIPNLGAFVDVFFLDKWPEDIDEREQYKKMIIKASFRYKCALPWKSYQSLSFLSKLKWIIYYKRLYNRYIVGLEKRKKERDELLEMYSNRNTGWRSVSFDDPNRTPWFQLETDIDDRILLKFEALEVYAPRKYDDLLKNTYGDYMMLPPENERKSHHHYTAYWKDSSM